MAQRPTIALLTDFGMTDWFAGSMKAVILARIRDCNIVDLCHGIEQGAVGQAAWLLERTYRDFPPATVFCCVVDPGVGTGRLALAAAGDGYFFVAPDNGLLTSVRRHVADWQCRAITNAGWMRGDEIGRTFHGRDVFAPAAAEIAREGAIDRAGEPVDEPVALDLPEATRNADGTVEGRIACFDQFGNAITNIARETAGDAVLERRIAVSDTRIERVSGTFADVAVGEVVAYWGSLGTLEIAVREGNAREQLSLALDDRVTL